MIKLSFIVPVYNVEQYLRKCIDSLLTQDISYSDYEIILVDDGSPDACPLICDRYAAAHKNVRVIHRENGGLSAARNSGIELAQGEYVCFVDSDDYWEPNVLGGLLAQVKKDNLEVLRFKYQNVNENYEVFNPYKVDPRRNDDYSKKVTDGVTFLNTRFSTNCYVSMFILHHALLENCIFTEGIYFEDTDWTPRMLVKAERVASTEKVVYNYLMRKGSITNAVERSKQKKILDDKMRLIKNLQDQGWQLWQSGKVCTWFDTMIADNVVSIIGILSTQFYSERKAYLKQLREMKVYPIQSHSAKARLINNSPRLAVELLHIKNG